jgi:hypothetical protein
MVVGDVEEFKMMPQLRIESKAKRVTEEGCLSRGETTKLLIELPLRR